MEKLTPKQEADFLIEQNQLLLSKHIFNGTYDIAIEISLLCVNKQLALIDLINSDSADNYYEEILQIKEELNKM
jgi:hypothetical protein